LGSLFDVPHGVANALLLPTVMEFNMEKCLDKYPEIARAMGVDITGMSREEASLAACEAVKALALKVGIPQHMTDLGITEADIPRLAEQAIADVCTPGNPRDVSLEQIEALYHKVL
ncbi:MAG: iron-containing alcohol dehydrogenase, partial [Muribaculaceae bacterium]|nr:iron-containing alcohol dehydrogenase [Muribaculaceae bacterium]